MTRSKIVTKEQAARLLRYKRLTSRPPRAYDNTTTQTGLERLIKAIRQQTPPKGAGSRVPDSAGAWPGVSKSWLRRLTGR